MKAYILNKLNLSRGSSKDRDNNKEKEHHKEKIPSLGPLPEWPPPQRVTSTPNSITSLKPLPELSSRDLPPIQIGRPIRDPSELPAESFNTLSSTGSTPTPTQTPIQTSSSSELDKPRSRAVQSPIPSRVDPSTTRKALRKASNENQTIPASLPSTVVDVHKKVAFISPAPTVVSERSVRSPTPTKAANSSPPVIKKSPSGQGRASTSTSATAVASPKIDATSVKAPKPSAPRSAPSPYTNKGFSDSASIQQSIRSNTPYSQSNSSSRILSPVSWSEVAEVDLVSNLGPRERTRQEVLWEIVTSEERYVIELLKMKETFIDALLHPYSTVPGASSSLDYDDYSSRIDTPFESIDRLPIASRFLSPTGLRADTPTNKVPSSPRRDDKEDAPNIDTSDDEMDDDVGKGIATPKKVSLSTVMKHNHPRSPYGATATRTRTGEVPFPSRSHQSLPAQPRADDSTQSLTPASFMGDGAQSTRAPTLSSRVLRKTHKSNPSDVVINGAIPPRQLPEDLRICLEVVENSLIDGHVKLAENLRKRYQEQYPLVRSLADVFVSNSHILTGYATFVLHLERALEQVDTALSTASNAPKKSKKQETDQALKVGTHLQKLEENAALKGETGLAISLSKPFQRLLKYPLLFQNLLFHTDPSTFEYESTLQMVAEVETIVRSIEDEKIQKEERDKTRDVFGRIDGLDKVKQLALPKPSRVLVEERLIMHNDHLSKPSSPPPVVGNGKVKGKTSFKRLSDVLQSGSNGIGGKKDLWLVVFNDVVLRCQRTGTTSLPIGGASNGRANSLPEFQGKAKSVTTGRRNSHTKPRNMYKFIKIETWDIGDVVQPRQGVVSMDEVVRSRTLHASVQPRVMPLPDDDEEEEAGDSDDSDRKSKMSFSYWGADKITIQKPVIKPRQLSSSQPSTRRVPTTGPASYGRESSANAKFGTRLISGEHQTASSPRPGSRRTGAITPIGRRQPIHTDDNHSIVVKATVTRPAWNESTRGTTVAIPKRSRNISQTSVAARTANNSGSGTTKISSPAPSEDSGVGMYRQIIAQNPSLTQVQL